ncbi:MAG: short chain dehydrogenase, partial [Actinomycetota bacterium]|nr:short chain dehydrogenase [Actinomycetota bacterium]
KRIATPIGTLGQLLYAINPKSMDYILNSAYKLFPDSRAARGDEKKAPAEPRGEEASNEQVAFAYLMRGVHW